MLNIYEYVYIRAVSANIQSWGVGLYETHLCLSFHACEVMLQKWICHLTHTCGSCRNMWIVHVTHMTEFISHIYVRHATHIKKYATHLNEIRRTYNSTSHVTYMNASWHSACLRQQYEMQRRVPGYQKLMKSSRILGTWDDHDFGINDGLFIPLFPPPLFFEPRVVFLYSCVLISKDDEI